VQWYSPVYELWAFAATVKYDIERSRQKLFFLLLVQRRTMRLPKDIMVVIGGFVNLLSCFL
jgi:hypothetical protein